jgi:hypothetical protein
MYNCCHISKTPKPVMQHQGDPDIEEKARLANYLLEK